MGTGRQYDDELKKQAVKLAKEVGNKAAAEELGIPKGTLGTWLVPVRSTREHFPNARFRFICAFARFGSFSQHDFSGCFVINVFIIVIKLWIVIRQYINIFLKIAIDFLTDIWYNNKWIL